MPNYIATYIVKGNEISTSTDGTQALSSVIGKQAYLYASVTNQSYCLIDLSQYMLREKNLDYTLQLQAIASSLTDFQIAGYSSDLIPFVDPGTGGFDHRLIVYDAYITSDVTVEYTSIETPETRNYVYQRDYLNDLVISSSSRDFSNCLVSVNGVFQKTYFFNKELYVKDGFSNIKNSKQNKVAIYDTTDLGGHIVIPITMSNIDLPNTTPFSGVTLTFPNMDFTGTTVLLVLGGYLYVLDDVYRLINTNRLMIDICKIDLIDQFLHDPNTSYVKNDTEIVADDTNGALSPNVVDEITYYLESVYPGAISNVTTSVNFNSYNLFNYEIPPVLTTIDMINTYLSNYPYIVPNGASVMFAEYEKYMPPTSVVNTITYSTFTDPRFLYSLLTKDNSFLIAIKNPNVYKRIYNLYRTQVPSQYVVYSENDTPRGILQYDKNRSLPYLIYTESNNLNYDISIDYSKTSKDVYKTAINPQYIASPKIDVKGDLNYPVRLLELYSP